MTVATDMSAGAAAGAASTRSEKAGKKPQAKRSAAPAKGSTTSGVSAARGRSRSQDAAAAKAAVAKNNAAKEAAKKVSGSTLIHFGQAACLGPCRLLTRSDGCQFVGGGQARETTAMLRHVDPGVLLDYADWIRQQRPKLTSSVRQTRNS